MQRIINKFSDKSGKARYALLLWLLGVPLPIILIIWMVKGCA